MTPTPSRDGRALADQQFLTVAEVAAILKLNQQTIRNWIDHGTLPALRIGRRVRVTRSDLDQLLADASPQPNTPAVAQYTAADFWDGITPPPADHS